VWIDNTEEEAERANARAAEIPGFMAYASLAEILSMDAGWMPVDQSGTT
jgi:hypothetical protein